MLSLIIWTNRGLDDNFDTVFGADAAAAREVVNAAIDDWEGVIEDFNRPDGDNWISVSISMDPSDHGRGGVTGDLTVSDHGFPLSGTITMESGDDGHGAGWWIDPTPWDSAEFVGTIIHAFSGKSLPSAGGPDVYEFEPGKYREESDLYTAVLHELGHVVGLGGHSELRLLDRGVDSDDDGYFDVIYGSSPDFAIRLTEESDDALNEDGGGDFWVFDGETIDALLTSSNGGVDAHIPVHMGGKRPGDVAVDLGAITVYGCDDLMTPAYRRKERHLISARTARVLGDIYGYTVNAPERFGTFYAVWNRTSGDLRIRGAEGNSDDNIWIRRLGDDLWVKVSPGNPVPGVDPYSGSGFESKFFMPSSNLRSITIDAGDGDDWIYLDADVPSNITSIYVDAGWGNDQIEIVGDPASSSMAMTIECSSGDDDVTLSDWLGTATVQGGFDSDSIRYTGSGAVVLGDRKLSRPNGGDVTLSSVESAILDGGTGADTFDVTQWTGGGWISGQGSMDTVVSEWDGTQTLTENTLLRSGADNLMIFGVESANLSGDSSSDSFVINGWLGGGTIRGNAGEDSIEVLGGDVGRVYTLSDHAMTLGSQVFSIADLESAHFVGGTGGDTFDLAGWTGTAMLEGQGGTDTLKYGGEGTFVLTDTQLDTPDGNLFSLASIEHAELTGGSGDGDHFDVTGWSRSAHIDGKAGTDSITSVASGTQVLTNTVLSRPAVEDIQLARIEVAMLAGAAAEDTFDVSGWTGMADINGDLGEDRIVSTFSGTQTLNDTSLSRTGAGTVSLSSVEEATLTGAGGADAFDVGGWSGTATLNGLGGSDAVIAAGNGDFVIADLELSRPGGGLITLSSVEDAQLTAGDGNNQFSLTGWNGSGTFNGAGGTDRLVIAGDADYTLTDSSLTRSVGGTMALTSIEDAQITAGDGNNTFQLSGWYGTASIDGGDGVDRIESSRSGTQMLQGSVLARTGGGDIVVAGIEEARLTGATGADTLEVTDWPGTAVLEGGFGNDNYTVGFLGSGSGTTTIVEETLAGSDSLTVNSPTPGIPIIYEPARVFGGNEAVFFEEDLENIVINAADDVSLSGADAGIILDVEASRHINVVNTAGFSAGNLLIINGGSVSAGNLINEGEIQLGGGHSEIGGGTLTNEGLLLGVGEVSAAVNNTPGGEIRVGQRVELRLVGLGGANSGAIHLDGGRLVLSEAFTNTATGFIAGRGVIEAVGGLVNNGSMAFSGGATNLYGQLHNLTGGRVIVSGGSTLLVHDDLSHEGQEIRTGIGRTVVYGSDVSGSGPFTGPGTSVFEARLSPGSSTAAVSFEGDAVFKATARLEIELGGKTRASEYDAVDIAGAATLDGTLAIELVNGFIPEPGDTFQIMTFGSRSGGFSMFEGLDLGHGPVYDLQLTDTALTLLVLDDDGDGLCDAIEDGAPNGGDGNNDGVPDSEQVNVSSLPNSATQQYVTLASPEATSLKDVQSPPNPSPGDTPPEAEFPVGFFEFAVSDLDVGGATTVTMFLPPGTTANNYFKFGPTPDNLVDHWYEFSFDGTTGAEILADRIVLHFVDGQRGDDGLIAEGEVVDVGAPALMPVVIMVDRYVFYNNSAFDGNNPAANEQDDLAIDLDKEPLLPGDPATFDNYTSYSRGINGIMVDIENLANPDELNVDNLGHYFEFRLGNSDDPTGWGPAPTPSDVAVRESPEAQNAKRVTITWDDYAIRNQWLQVTVLADADYTGLTDPDVFYFGNAVGESGNSDTDAEVNDTDVASARHNPHNFFNPAEVTCLYDYNRDARVNATDMLISRSNPTDESTALKLIHPPALEGDGQSEESAIPTSYEEDPALPAIRLDARLGKWTWLYEFDQMSPKNRPSEKYNPAEEAVDKLLATCWP